MKTMKYILLTAVVALGLSSCDKSEWLDVNQDPDNPTSTSATPEIRLPWVQNYFTYAWGSASMRSSLVYGVLTQTSKTSANGYLAGWDPLQSSATTPYQNFFIGSGVNIQPLIDKASSVGANHYVGAAYVIKSMGFNLMGDLFGEMPMAEAFTGKYNPSYDDGKALWFQSMEALDKGIEYLEKSNTGAVFASGDCWLDGDAAKWKKFAYGLKARYIAKLSKKFGKPIETKNGTVTFTEDDVLAALEKALQSNDDNVSVKNYNVEGDQTNVTVGDPYQANMLWNSLSYGYTQLLTKYYIDLFKANDPRIDKLVPSIMTDITYKNGAPYSYKWTRGQGVDMMGQNGIRNIAGSMTTYVNNYANTTPITQTYDIKDDAARAAFIADMEKAHVVTVADTKVSVTYALGQMYNASTDYRHAGDTIYADLCSQGYTTNGTGEYDSYYYQNRNKTNIFVAGTGSFYGRIFSDLDIMTYAELCFLKAEMLLRKGENAKALQAYKDGVKANFDRMQSKLNEWKGQKTSSRGFAGENPSMQPMDDAEVAAYLAEVNAKSSVDIAEIMREKVIAVSFNYELWNDMRRYDYNNGTVNGVKAFPNYLRPSEFTATNKIIGATTTDQADFSNVRAGFRRLMHSSHESNYNKAQLIASNPHAIEDEVFSIPVWWDCATDEEYYSYGPTKTY